ncbi:MAG: T9SS type A sorting domain-containing protein [Tannerella sp.]|nr:T9SS type A sorting domain-containing protein [Tannerella sp.]
MIHQDKINISVRIDDVGNATVSATDVHYFDGRLLVNTPVAERIAVYSLDGRMIYQAQKQSGIAAFNLYSLPKGVLIVRSDSGWVKKIIR